ncbi:MAG TPA: hypothetical protein VGL73_16290 [Caulobacteraceae bacterium]
MRNFRSRPIAAVLLAASLAACGGSGQPSSAVDRNNPLIGHWRFSGVGSDPNAPLGGCASEMVFTATQQTLIYSGAPRTNDVTYNASPTLVYVMGNTGIVDHVTYNVLDANHVQLDAAGPCTYVRAG